ncbi:MAG TPA: SGNH/GDSL hydrolase family protein, partial [Vicinamibacteria bacterium]|nr:SGNH/GDSL hydrolase family protein [Vicinamibacteria bacterium]
PAMRTAEGGSRARRLLFRAAPTVALLLALAAVEAAVRVARPPLSALDLFVTAPEQQAQFLDARRVRVFEGDPLLFWRLKPGLREVIWDQTPVTTNAQGLRYDRDLGPKRPGGVRVLCAGDSVTFGFRVPLVFLKRPGERHPAWRPYPARLEAALRAANPGREIEVVPLAVPGYSTHQGLAWLRRDLGRYDPDLVVLLFGWNDISLRGRADAEAMSTAAAQVAARQLLSRSQLLMRAWRWARAGRAAPAAGPVVPRVSVQEFVANHVRMAGLARAHGAEVVVLGPVFRDSAEHPGEAERMGAYRTALRDAMAAHSLPYLEVPELTEAGWPGNEALFLEHIHPNHAGHRVLAAALLRFLHQRRLLRALTVPPDPAP